MKKKLVIISALAVFISMAGDVSAIGMRTEPIIFNDAIRGQDLDTELILMNPDSKEVIYDFESSGQIAEWVSFYSIDGTGEKLEKISIPAKSRVRAIARFKTPVDVPNGIYEGMVSIVQLPDSSLAQEGKALIRHKINRSVSINVTDKENISLQTAIAPISYSLAQGESLKIEVRYDNLGNVDIKPDVDLKILKDGKNIYNAIFPYPADADPVKPLTQKTMPIFEWPTAGQPLGEYEATVAVMRGGTVLEDTTFTFHINEPPASAAGAQAGPNKNIKYIFIALGAIPAIIGGWLLMRKRTFQYKKPRI